MTAAGSDHWRENLGFRFNPEYPMRTLLQITALSLLFCAGLLIASHGQDTAPPETGRTSTPGTFLESTSAPRTDRQASIRTTKLSEGKGSLNIPPFSSGHLIVTSLSPNFRKSNLRISRTGTTNVNHADWEPLAPLNIPMKQQPLPSEESGNASVPPDRDSDASKPGGESERTFFLHVTDGPLNDPRQYVPVHSRLLAEGQQVRVFVDKQRPESARVTELAGQMIATLEEQILPQANREIGAWEDVDRDGKLAVLLTPWLGELQGGQTSLQGFVRGSDFRPHYPAPFGNQADVIYFNSESSPGGDLLTLLAHEYWHVLQCSFRLSRPEIPLPVEDDWINEGTAHLAEIRFGGNSGNLEHRIEAWLASPESAPLVVENYYTSGLWRDEGCRGATFLFFKWCQDRFGRDLPRRLLTASASGARNLELVTGNDLETLQVHWSVAMLEQSRASGSSADETQPGPMFAGIPGFEHITLGSLQIHSLHDVKPGESRRIVLAPTATCFLRVDSGDWKLECETAVPLRVTWVPEPSTDSLAKKSPASEAIRR